MYFAISSPVPVLSTQPNSGRSCEQHACEHCQCSIVTQACQACILLHLEHKTFHLFSIDSTIKWLWSFQSNCSWQLERWSISFRHLSTLYGYYNRRQRQVLPLTRVATLRQTQTLQSLRQICDFVSRWSFNCHLWGTTRTTGSQFSMLPEPQRATTINLLQSPVPVHIGSNYLSVVFPRDMRVECDLDALRHPECYLSRAGLPEPVVFNALTEHSNLLRAQILPNVNRLSLSA